MVSRKKNAVVQLSKIRIREGLRRNLAHQAELDLTTLNGEISRRLEESFVRDFQEEKNTAVVNMLVSQRRISAAVLRWIVMEFQKHPDWAKTPDGIEAMALFVADCVRTLPKTEYDSIHDFGYTDKGEQ